MGVFVPTAERVYQTYLRAVTYIIGKHQPWPHEEAMRLNIDPTTRGLLGLEEDVKKVDDKRRLDVAATYGGKRYLVDISVSATQIKKIGTTATDKVEAGVAATAR
jgi:hypothetical protein